MILGVFSLGRSRQRRVKYLGIVQCVYSFRFQIRLCGEGRRCEKFQCDFGGLREVLRIVGFCVFFFIVFRVQGFQGQKVGCRQFQVFVGVQSWRGGYLGGVFEGRIGAVLGYGFVIWWFGRIIGISCGGNQGLVLGGNFMLVVFRVCSFFQYAGRMQVLQEEFGRRKFCWVFSLSLILNLVEYLFNNSSFEFEGKDEEFQFQ